MGERVEDYEREEYKGWGAKSMRENIEEYEGEG